MMSLLYYLAAVSTSPDLSPLPDVQTNNKFDLAIMFAFGLAGALSLLFIVIGGLRYVASQGDPNNVGQAKGTILYALAGLVITVLAYAIVQFVAGRL